MAMIGPNWWHHHGAKMVVKLLDKRKRLLIIKGSAAEVGILPITMSSVGERWLAKWEVIHSFHERVAGGVLFTADELRAAVGLPTDLKTSTEGGVFLGRPQIDFAVQGKFVRTRNYLNIPCSGTGHDGDPNVSIEVDDQIRSVVQELLTS